MAKLDGLPKRNLAALALRKAADKEMFQFVLNEPFYTVDMLIALGLESKIPNLIKLNKRTNGIKILNIGGVPVLHIKTKKDENE